MVRAEITRNWLRRNLLELHVVIVSQFTPLNLLKHVEDLRIKKNSIRGAHGPIISSASIMDILRQMCNALAVSSPYSA